MLPTLLFVIFLIVIGVLVYYVYQEENEITRKLKEEVTPGLGGEYAGDKSYQQEIEPELLTLLTGRLGRLVQLINIIKGEFQGEKVKLFTYSCHIRQNNRTHTLRQTVIAIKTAAPHSPKFLIRPPELMDELKKMVGYEFVQLPAAGNLAIQVHQEGVDDQLVFQHVPAATWQNIQQHSLIATHDGHWFIIYQYNHRLDPTLEAYQQFLKIAIEVYHTLLAGKSTKEK